MFHLTLWLQKIIAARNKLAGTVGTNLSPRPSRPFRGDRGDPREHYTPQKLIGAGRKLRFAERRTRAIGMGEIGSTSKRLKTSGRRVGGSVRRYDRKRPIADIEQRT